MLLSPFAITPGQRLTPATFRLTPGEVAAYCLAVGEAGQPGSPPPLLLAARALRLLMAQVDIPAGTVHGGQECEFYAPASLGRLLTVEASAVRAATRQGQRFLTLEMAVRDDGDLLCRGRASLIIPEPSSGEAR